ncbi:glycosyltransferase [Paraburkholderia sp. LEh10]|uniref:glycosyltransferase n=1 Tax=Paraburkholderia sp. LEh10 TaxID=2821353 RepID=UPI001AE3FB0A|nr:glycosyltransferase [Paraburkholderia sp. LEh10]MBP0593892.1 glycosyltransferase [Paraburkholderia sp. LEh10]
METRAARFAEERRIIEEAGLFDEAFYRRKYPDVEKAGLDPLEHYIEWGGKEGRRPHPSFDPRWYTTQYPDVAQSGIHPLIHYLTIGKKEGRRCGLDSRILSTVASMYQEAADFEPAIALDASLNTPHLLDIHGGGQDWPALRVWRALFESLDRPFDYVIFVGSPLRESDVQMAACAAQAAVEAHGAESALVVFTDYEEMEACDCFGQDVCTRSLSNFGESLTGGERASIVEKLILSVRPKAVLNVDSAACWDAILRKGAALQMASDLYACLHSDNVFVDGSTVNFAHSHFRECLPFLRKVYFDNLHFEESLASVYGVPPSLRSRLATLYRPLRGEGIATYKATSSTQSAIVWGGQIDSQASVDLLLQIAARAPDLMFDVFANGSSDQIAYLRDAALSSANVTLRGSFVSVSRLPVNNYCAFLHTSFSDRLPFALVEACATGIPVVAPAVSGIAELVTSKTGWPVDRYEDPESYIQALRQIREDSQLTTSKSTRMVEHVQEQHSQATFMRTLRASPSFID